MSFVVDDTTETRVAIKDGKRAIAYLAIGQDQYAELFAAAPEMLRALELAKDALVAGAPMTRRAQAWEAVTSAIIRAMPSARRLPARNELERESGRRDGE